MHVISNIALISINETLFIELISFLIFVLLINRIMFRPLRESMKTRDTHILAVENEIHTAEKELQALNQKLKEEELAAVFESQQQKKALIEAGTLRADDLLDEVKKEIQQLKAAAQQEVDQQIQKARKTLTEEAQKLAVSIMEKLLDRRIRHE